MIVYISAPYTLGDVSVNVKTACLAGDRILELGHIPFIPHLFNLWDSISPKSYDDWMKICKAYVIRCDCLLRLEGISKGADIEVNLAKQYNIPVFYSFKDLPTLPKKEN